MYFMVGFSDVSHKYRIVDTTDYAIDDCTEREVQELLVTGTQIENLGISGNRILCTQGSLDSYGGLLNCSRVTYTMIGVANNKFIFCTNKKEIVQLSGNELLKKKIKPTNIDIKTLRACYSPYFTAVIYKRELVSGYRYVPIFIDSDKDIVIILDIINEVSIFADVKMIGRDFVENIGIHLGDAVCYYTREGKFLGVVTYTNGKFVHKKAEDISNSDSVRYTRQMQSRSFPHIELVKEVTQC